MKKACIVGSLCWVLLLAPACSSGSPTTVCGSRQPSPAMAMNGPVSIETDHTVYAPSDMIVVTITNHLQPGIAVIAESRYCPFVAMQQLVGTMWEPLGICFPEDTSEAPLGPPIRRLYAEQSLTIHLVDMTVSTTPTRRPFPTGAFHLVVTYSAPPTLGLPSRITVYSETIYICTCGSCA